MNCIEGVALSGNNDRILKELVGNSESKSDVISDFWRFMIVCFNTPRPSTNYDGTNNEQRTEPFRRVCKRLCSNSGLCYTEDGVGNIIIRNFNDSNTQAKFCFQGHMDVVVSRNESVIHDFETEGVDVRITNEGTIKPIKGITLGADNGVAIACALAVLRNNMNVPLELLITKNEETSFDGACGLDPTKITAPVVVNLDSEVERAICVGSAGGFEHRFTFPLTRGKNDLPTFEIRLRDLKGGHSGVDIEGERSNAILILARILFSEEEKPQVSICSLRGGTSSNAIPREASAVIAGTVDQVEAIRGRFNDIKSELSISEPTIRLEIEETSASNTLPATTESTRKLLALIFSLGTGVVRKLAGCVESSYNLGLVSTESDEVSLKYLIRSSSVSWMKAFSSQFSLIGRMAGARVEDFVGFFGAWEPHYNSKIVNDLMICHPQPSCNLKTYTVHAGLECSTILERFASIGRTNVECASIGPQIENAHSPDECLYIGSAEEFVQWVNNLVVRA